MHFRVADSLALSTRLRQWPLVLLSPEEWDDFRFNTTFSVRLLEAPGRVTHLGIVKILQRNRKSTTLPLAFDGLPRAFTSLGQGRDYYEALCGLKPQVGRAILSGLRDVAFDSSALADARSHAGFAKSMTRMSSAQKALRDAPAMLATWNADKSAKNSGGISFNFHRKFDFFRGNFRIGLAFDRNPLARMITLVGPNASGKTQFFGALARALTGYEQDGSLTHLPPLGVFALSYSFFDDVERPVKGQRSRHTQFRPRDGESYRYWGPLSLDGSASLGELRAMTRSAFIALSRASRARLKRALDDAGLSALEPQLKRVLSKGDLAPLDHMSSGTQVAFMAICALVADLRRDDLVLFDEPELHLHPQLLSGVLRTLTQLLDERDAFALVATHSPIPVQETLGSHVRIVDVTRDRVPIVRRYPGESFGENLGEIVRVAFREDPERANYYARLLPLRSDAKRVRSQLHRALPLAVDLALREEDS